MKLNVFFLISLELMIIACTVQEQTELEKESVMNVTAEIRLNGYPAESYKVTTPDGYILEIQRIPYGKNQATKAGGPPIFILHGLAGESALFVDKLNGSLAFKFADAGFDVWLGNMRGNRYGLAHTELITSQTEFWNFTWDDIAAKDVPTMLDFVLKTTKVEKLYYAGLSMGNGVGMMLLASKPEWNKKIKGFAGMMPVTRLTYAPWVQVRALNIASYLLNISPAFITSTSMLTNSSSPCYFPNFICDAVFGTTGWDPRTSYLTLPRTAMYSNHSDSGTSLMCANQGFQMSLSHDFPYYNYGPLGNWRAYNSFHPPAYDLTKITVPVALFTSDNDPAANSLDIARLIRDLPNVYSHYNLPHRMFSHTDFNIGIPSERSEMYDEIVKVMKQMEGF